MESLRSLANSLSAVKYAFPDDRQVTQILRAAHDNVMVALLLLERKEIADSKEKEASL